MSENRVLVDSLKELAIKLRSGDVSSRDLQLIITWKTIPLSLSPFTGF